MRLPSRLLLVFASLVVHVALGASLGAMKPRRVRETIAISIHETPKMPPKLARPVDPKPPPEPAPRPARAKSVASRAPKAAAAAARAPAPLEAMPDFGLSLSGAAGAGLAVAAGGSSEPPTQATAKVLSAPAAARPKDDCADPPAKPHALSSPSPVYPASARAAGVSGAVRVEITVDPQGRPAAVRLLQGLGHGLDEAALAAARAATFEPPVRCGKPAVATVRVRYTFAPPSP